MNTTPDATTKNTPPRRTASGLWVMGLLLGAAAFAVGYGMAGRSVVAAPDDVPELASAPVMDDVARIVPGLPPIKGFAGKFLASHYAQTSYDWETAARYLDQVLVHDPDNFDLIKRSMVLAMGTGDSAAAALRAQEMLLLEPTNGFARLIVAVDALAREAYDEARTALHALPDGDMTAFAKPLLLGWTEVAEGKLEVSGLAPVPMHLYHGALMAHVTGSKEPARSFAGQIMQIKGLTQNEAMRVADILAAIGDNDKAQGLYQGLKLQEGADESAIDRKIEALGSADEAVRRMAFPPLQITNAQKGAALALYDMAAILYQEESDSSAKLFAQMAIAVDPELTEGRLLLAQTMVRNERFEEAITILKTVPDDHPSYLESQRQAAQLLSEAGRRDDALAMMESLYKKYNDIEALIRIGDIHRYAEDYAAALKAYNRAAKVIGPDVPEEYWHLLYARGMVNEREGHWKDAVADLKAAVEYRPNHPYLLNYLGYGWADKGENLEESLEMIRRAVALRPLDGYITDSLGWVLYRMNRFEEAVPHLERAVELLPYDATINDHLGDAYWRVGRKMEARFQWRRALNSDADEELQAQIEKKLKSGMPPLGDVRSAATRNDGDPEVKSE